MSLFRIKKNNVKGFTLLEMILALGIFIILFTLTLGIYSYALRAEQKTTQLSRLQKEAQLIMEIVAKKVRNSRIDYAWYSGELSSPESSLALLDKSAERTVFKLKTDVLGDNFAICSLGDCVSDDDFSIIPASNIVIASLNFYISPLVDPFSLDELPSEYPRVTIVVDLEHTQGGITRNMLVQQTIPQRLGGF